MLRICLAFRFFDVKDWHSPQRNVQKNKTPQNQTSATLTYPEKILFVECEAKEGISYTGISKKTYLSKAALKRQILQTTGTGLLSDSRFKTEAPRVDFTKRPIKLFLNVSRKEAIPAGELDTSLEILKHSLRISQGKNTKKIPRL